MQKNVKKFQELFKTLKFSFRAVCLSETWCESLDSKKEKKKKKKIGTIGFIDMNLFIKLAMVAKEEGSVYFYVTRFLMK